MRIAALEVENFRSLRRAAFDQLPDMVVVAGPNGCGKSTLFDAVRLLKSTYGGYHANEWEQFFGEHQISLDRNQPELLNLFRDSNYPLRVGATFGLDESERAYLSDNAENLIRPQVWESVSGPGRMRPARRSVADEVRQHGARVKEQTARDVEEVRSELRKPEFVAQLTIHPNLDIEILSSPALQLAFSLFRPDRVGIIDYHSAQRHYVREQLGGINLSLQSSEQQYSQTALYNSSSKYQNIKSQMAASYIRELLEREATGGEAKGPSLIDTLKEMFELFFPEKHFVGAVPTSGGKLMFPVRTASGKEHDIDDLSSGEKEVLYGYLRLQNVSPRNSVLLLDEPELHLNPRLIRGLPQFYHRNLGVSLNNQIWLLTHSDALLREAVGQDGYAVFHMQAPRTSPGVSNQIHRLSIREDLDRAVVDLVGDLAAFRPGGTIVICEGGGDTDFDVSMIRALFPKFAAEVNLISGTNKSRVRELHGLLQLAAKKGIITSKVYSIVDGDLDSSSTDQGSTFLAWNVYHIENYLLEPQFILQALSEALGQAMSLDEAEVYADLRAAAALTVADAARVRLERWANDRLVSQIRIGGDPSSLTLVSTMMQSIQGSKTRLADAANNLLSGELAAKSVEINEQLELALSSDEWRSSFRGRDILRRFAGRRGGIGYEVLRNLIIARMRAASYEPAGMKGILERVVVE